MKDDYLSMEILRIRTIKKWVDDGGSFDYDHLMGLLKDYDAEISKLYDEEIKELQHFKDSTLGLWATDRPDLVEDPENVLFCI